MKKIANDSAARILELSNTQKESGRFCSSSEISELVGFSRQAVRRVLKRNGVPINKCGGRKYVLNEAFFDVIDTEAKAWILGFVTADGCVNGNALHVLLSRKDREVLEEMKDRLESNAVISDKIGACRFVEDGVVVSDKKTKISLVRFHSKRLCRSLEAHGVVPKKTLHEYPSPYVPDCFLNHYIRGLMDGDGCYTGQADKASPVVHLCGSRSIVEWFSDVVEREIGKRPSVRSGRCWMATLTSRREVIRFIDYVYQDASVFLRRKKDVAYWWRRTCLDALPGERSLILLNAGHLEVLKERCGTWESVADVLGVSSASVYKARKRTGLLGVSRGS